jgi:hypothetical protein
MEFICPELKRLNIFEKMRGLHTDIMEIRRKTLIEIAKMILEDKPPEYVEMIPYNVIPRDVPTYRDSVSQKGPLSRKSSPWIGLDSARIWQTTPCSFDVHEALQIKR